MTTTANLTLPVLEAGQAQKHVTVNEALHRLDALVQLSVVSATMTAQPGAPAEGAVYILPGGKTGAAWATMTDGALAHYRGGAWEKIAPREGWIAYVRDTDLIVFYTGSAWAGMPATKALTLSATDKVLGRVSASSGAAEEVAFTDQAQQLCDDTSFAAMLATLGAMPRVGAFGILGTVLASMNTTADQQFTAWPGVTFNTAIINNIRAMTPSTDLSASPAAGGIYTGAGKTGVVIASASQSYAALSATGKGLAVPTNADTLGAVITGQPYLSLTTAHGTAATVRFYILGVVLS